MTKRGASITFGCAAFIVAAIYLAPNGFFDPVNYPVADWTQYKQTRIRVALTVEQLEKLDKYFQRHPRATQGDPPGVTVEQALKDQDDWVAQQAAKLARAQELKEKAEAERAEKQQEFAKLLSVTLLSKKNQVHVDEQRFVVLEIAYDNKTDKAVRSVAGVLKLVDPYGGSIMDVKCNFDAGISAKHTAVDHGYIVAVDRPTDPEADLDPQGRLWGTDFDRITATFEVSTIVYKDGTIAKNPRGGA